MMWKLDAYRLVITMYLGAHNRILMYTFRLAYYLDYAVDYAVRKFYSNANSI